MLPLFDLVHDEQRWHRRHHLLLPCKVCNSVTSLRCYVFMAEIRNFFHLILVDDVVVVIVDILPLCKVGYMRIKT